MATVYKILGQSAPSATTDTDVYTVPAATETVISTIVVANRSTAQATYRIALRQDGVTIANTHYIAYGATVPANDSIALTFGLTINAADIVTVYASTADLTFSIFGSEIS
jgi:hypothetical protein